MFEKRKLKIAVSYISYPITMAMYFVRALQRRDDVELVTIGPYTGTKIPWAGGIDIPPKYVHTPTIPLPEQTIAMGGIPYELVANKMPFEPDLWLEIDAGWHFKTKPKAGIVAHILTDPHCLGAHYAKKKDVDVTFNMQTPYMRPGDLYLPYGFDPTIYYPEDVEKVDNGCLIGLHYQQRDTLVNRLRSVGYKIHYTIGEVFDENRRAYNQSDVALSWSSMQDLPVRVFEGMGMGLPVLSNRLPDLGNFFVEGEHYLGFDSVDEAEKKFSMLMSDDDMRWEIGNAAYRKVVQGHTFDHRIQQILETVKLI